MPVNSRTVVVPSFGELVNHGDYAGRVTSIHMDGTVPMAVVENATSSMRIPALSLTTRYVRRWITIALPEDLP
jgi:hypothetical protein